MRQVESIKGPYDELAKNIPGFAEKYSMLEWRNINCMVNSRAFGVFHDNFIGEDQQQKKCLALVPFSDMLNHSKDFSVSWYFDNERKGFVMVAARDIKRGEECFDTYGDSKSNDLFLL